MARKNTLQTENVLLREKIASLEARLSSGPAEPGSGSERFRALFETMPLGVVYQDPDGVVSLVNQAAERLLGLSSADLVGVKGTIRPLYVIHEDGTDFPQHEHPAMQAIRTGQAVNDVIAGIYIPAMGAYRWLLVNSMPEFRPGETTPFRAYSTFIDISERRSTQEALSRSHQLLQAIIDTAPLRIFWKDHESRYLGCNPSFARDAGMATAQDLVGKTDYELSWHDQAALYRADDRLVMETGIAKIDYEEPQVTPDGGLAWLRTSKVPLRDKEDQVIGVLGVYEDITERKMESERLRQTEDRYQNFIAHSFEAISRTEFFQPIDTSLPVETQIDLIYKHAYLAECNQAMAEMYGSSSPEEFIGTQLFDAHGGKDNGGNRAAFRRFIENGYKSINDETIEYTLDGRQVWFLNNTLGTLQDGYLVRLWGTAIDITDRKRAEELVYAQRDLARVISTTRLGQDAWAACLEIALRISNLDCGGIYLFDKNQVLELVYHQGLSPAFVELSSRYTYNSPNVQMLLTGKTFFFSEKDLRHQSLYQAEGLLSVVTIAIHYQEQVIGCINLGSHTLLEVPMYVRQMLEAIAAEIGSVVVYLRTEASLRASEEQYRSLVNSQESIISTIDNAGVFHYVNSHGASLFGKTAEEIVGRNLAEFFPADEAAEQLAVIASVSKTGKGLVREREINLLIGPRWFRTSIQPVWEAGGQVALVMLNSQDITERRQMEQTLAANERRYRMLIENISDGIELINANGVVTYASPSAARVLGYSQEQLLGSVAERVHPDDLQEALLTLGYVLSTHETISHSYRVQHQDGSWRWIEGSATNLLHDAAIGSIVVTFRDVTERRQAELEIARSNQTLVATLNALPDLLFELDDERRIIDFRAPDPAQLIASPAQFLGKTVFEAMPEEAARVVDLALDDAVANGQHFGGTYKLTVPTGVEWFELSISTKWEKTKTRPHFIVLARDITRRKKIEQDLRESTERFTQLANNVPEIFWISDPVTGKNLYISPAFEAVMGISIESLDKLPGGFPDLVLEEDRNLLKTAREHQLRGLKTDIQYRIRQPNGQIRWLRDKSSPVFDEAGQVVRVVGIVRDLTEQVEADARLRESEARFRQIAENIYEVFWMFDHQLGQIIYISPAYEKIWGNSPESLYQNGLQYLEAIHPDDRKVMMASLAEQARGDMTEIEYRVRRPDGSIRWVHDRSFPIFNEHGVVVRTTGIATDITERKKAEKLLEQRVEDLAFINNLNQAVNQGDSLEQITRILSLESRRIFQCRDAAVYLLSADGQHLILQHLTLPDSVKTKIEKVIGSSIPPVKIEINSDSYFTRILNSECGVITSDPHILRSWMAEFVETSYVPVHLRSMLRHLIPQIYRLVNLKSVISIPLRSDGKVVGIVELSSEKLFTEQDLERLQNIGRQLTGIITRKQVEESLLQSEERYRHLVEDLEVRVRERTAEVHDLYDNAPCGYHSLNANGEVTMVNQTELNWLGYKREDVIGRRFLDFISPESQPVFEENFPSFKQRGWVSGLEFNLVRQDGSTLPVLMGATAIRDEQGNYVMSRSTVFDVTERKEAENALRASEERFHNMFEKHNAVMLLVEVTTGRIIDANGAAEEFYGYSVEQLKQMSIQDINILAADDVAQSRKNASQGNNNFFVFSHRLSNGEIRSVEVHSSPIVIHGDSILFSIIHDVTERQKAEDALRESEAQNRLLFEEAPDSITLLDKRGRLVRANRAFELLTHYSLEALLGHNTDKLGLIPGEIRNYVREDAGNPPEPFAISDHVLVNAQGQRLNVESRIFPVKLGGNTHFLVTTRDISTHKKAEEALRRANVEMERAMRMKDEFLASMSHELRTPLTGILGLAEALQYKTYGELNDKQARALKNIETSGRHLLDLINDILDLSKIEAGKLDLHLEPCSLGEVCQASLHMIKGISQQKHQIVTFSANPASVIVQADPRRIKQMLVNLLGNAVKFTPEGGTLGLDMQLFEPAGQVCLTVWDRGAGIRPEDLTKLFKPFVQLDSSLSRQYGGTGLGLSLVQKMAELHGGSVQVESTPGEGSRFTIILPWSAKAATQVMSVARRVTGSLRQVMVIEDNPLDAEQVTRYLQNLGMSATVHPCVNGAIEAILKHKPGMVLLDIKLDDHSGFEVLSKLKANELTREIPVIITSVEESRNFALSMGAVGYLIKPFTQEDLSTELERVRSMFQVAEPAETNATGPLVFVVDDNEIILEIVSDFLQSQGYRAMTTSHPRDLLEPSTDLRPDLILMDIQMPGMDGLEAIRRIRIHPDLQLARTPIIAITALTMPGDRERCLEAGANEYMGKPVHLKNLLTAIEDLLSQRSLQS